MPGTGVSPPGPEDGADEEASSVCRPGVASTVAAGISDPSVPAVSSGLAGTDFESLSLAWATAPVGGSCSSGASAEGPKTPAAVCASSAAAFAASSCRLGLPQSFMTLISAGYCDSPGGGTRAIQASYLPRLRKVVYPESPASIAAPRYAPIITRPTLTLTVRQSKLHPSHTSGCRTRLNPAPEYIRSRSRRIGGSGYRKPQGPDGGTPHATCLAASRDRKRKRSPRFPANNRLDRASQRLSIRPGACRRTRRGLRHRNSSPPPRGVGRRPRRGRSGSGRPDARRLHSPRGPLRRA